MSPEVIQVLNQVSRLGLMCTNRLMPAGEIKENSENIHNAQVKPPLLPNQVQLRSQSNKEGG